MKEFNFEYTDTKFTLKLLGFSFLAFTILLIAMAVTVDLLGFLGALIVAFGVPLLIFLLNKKKIKKKGAAILFDSSAEFKLEGTIEKIHFADIKSYQVERYYGTHLKMKLKNGKDFKLQANSNFCDPSAFEIYCREFEKAVQQFKTSNNIELIRHPSLFEKGWMLPFLIVLSAGLVGGIALAASQEKNIPPTFYTSIAIIIPMWIGYLNARKRKKEQQH